MRFWRSGSALLLVCVPVQAQLRSSLSRAKAGQDSVTVHRSDELTLAGLRPGRDVMAKAQHMFSKLSAIGDGGISRTWQDVCRRENLSIIPNSSGTILEIRGAEIDSRRECADFGASRWATGHGLVIGNSCP
jgi:hypothetical protein